MHKAVFCVCGPERRMDHCSCNAGMPVSRHHAVLTPLRPCRTSACLLLCMAAKPEA